MSIAENIADIKTELGEQVKLIAVSKKQPEERIDAALQSGHRIYGENRVQEAQERWLDRRTQYTDLELHLIGSLQSNKAGDAVALFDVIHTIDREKVASALSKEMKRQNRYLPCFIQVNTGEEEQKSGILPEDIEALYKYCTEECALNIIGLMCIPPTDQPPALHFAFLKKLAENLGVSQLSMGMSGDYEKAVALGATHIRVGSALFGERIQD